MRLTSRSKLTGQAASTLSVSGTSSGCSACNQPGQFASDFYGVGAAWIGVNTCPYPTVTGDNAVHTDGWGIGPEPLKAVMLVGMANGPMALDSIIIRHRAEGTGPMRL